MKPKIIFAALISAGALSLGAAPAGAVNLLANPGFESGALSPWYQARDFDGHGGANWFVQSDNVHSGSFAARADDNYELRQDVTPTAASSIVDISVWSVNSGMAYDLFYTDGTDNEFVIYGDGENWMKFNLTSNLDPSKTLSGISFWGNTGYVAFIDDASITTGVPEPAAWALMLLGVSGLGLGLRGRRTLAAS